MAATVQIRRLTGANGSITSTDITSGSVHAGTQDSNTSPCAIPVPTSGSNHSYWVTAQLNCTASADNALNNIKFWTDGANSFGTGITAIVSTASGYVQATGTTGSSGILLSVGNYATLATGGASDLFLYTSSCKLTVAGSLAGATTGSFGDRVVSQLSIISTAGAGNSVAETLNWQWDES